MNSKTKWSNLMQFINDNPKAGLNELIRYIEELRSCKVKNDYNFIKLKPIDFSKIDEAIKNSSLGKTVNTLFGIRYPMCKDQPAQIDCRDFDCKYHKDGSCLNVSPALTLSKSCSFVCWSRCDKVKKPKPTVQKQRWGLLKDAFKNKKIIIDDIVDSLTYDLSNYKFKNKKDGDVMFKKGDKVVVDPWPDNYLYFQAYTTDNRAAVQRSNGAIYLSNMHRLKPYKPKPEIKKFFLWLVSGETGTYYINKYPLDENGKSIPGNNGVDYHKEQLICKVSDEILFDVTNNKIVYK